MRPDKNTGIDEQTGILRYGQPSFALHQDISEFFYLSVPPKYRYKFTDTKTKHTNKDALQITAVDSFWDEAANELIIVVGDEKGYIRVFDATEIL